MFTDVALPYRIYSSPVPWQPDANSGMAFAIVTGKVNMDDTSTAVDAYFDNGRRVSGFPILRDRLMAVAPGNQIVKSGKLSPPIVVDVHGRWWSLPTDQKASAIVANGHPAAGLLATSAVVLEGRNYLLLSRNFRPHIDSQNALSVLNASGAVIAGYPVTLSGIPESIPMVLDKLSARVWVMLQSGQVDGFQLVDGKRLPGFPTSIPDGERPSGGYRFAMSSDGAMLVVSQGTPKLLRIDVQTGKSTSLMVQNAQRLTAIATVGEKLCAFDEGTGSLLVLDSNGRKLADLGIVVAGSAHNVLMEKLVLTSDALLLLSAPRAERESRINQLYDERAPSEVKARLVAKINERIRREYGSKLMTTEQQKEMEGVRLELKEGWLENAFGITALGQLLSVPAATRIQVVAISENGLVTLVDDTVNGFTPETGFSHSEQVLPVIWTDPSKSSVRLLVPLNAAVSRNDRRMFDHSVVRIYTLPVQ